MEGARQKARGLESGGVASGALRLSAADYNHRRVSRSFYLKSVKSLADRGVIGSYPAGPAPAENGKQSGMLVMARP